MGKLKNTPILSCVTDFLYCLRENYILLHISLPQLKKEGQGDIFLMQRFLLFNPTSNKLRRLMDCCEYLYATI